MVGGEHDLRYAEDFSRSDRCLQTYRIRDRLGAFALSSLKTLKRVAAAFVVAMVLGSIIGVMLGTLPRLNRWAEPWVILAQNLPALVVIVQCYLWFGVVGDDLIGSVSGGGLLSKISRRFGEGVVNGALTARVGVAAMEVCRPLPFSQKTRPSVSKLVSRALTGLFGKS